MKDKLSINIVIENRGYPLVIDRKNEETYRQAAKLLNEMINRFKMQFADKDSQDFIAMAAFQIVLNYLEEKKDEKYDLLVDEIKNLNDDGTEFLNQKTVTES
ncbi:MAG: cell division protein ZapA [Prolixibacteraceae bacterium]|nr:cell division protein ZapA [Prolixibacteraceae bacterium]